jgi:divalent metal cation (Fe/Co/Zn/Cd) transporter
MTIELPVAAVAPTAASPEWLRLARRAKLLAWTSLAWLCVEGTVAVAAGLAAGSIALVGFGLDSAIEGLASFIVIWRFSGSRMLSADAERRAQKLVAASFFLLAPYVAAEALHTLSTNHHADTSWVGIGLATGTLFICPWLGLAKRRLGTRLGSAATRGEGAQNLLCASLAVGLILGLLGNALFGLWWLDPAVAFVIAGVAIRNGRQAWRGEACCDACGT